MQRKFVSSLLLLLFVNLLIKPIWIFGIDLQVQNRVGAEAYGFYSAVFSFTLIFNILLDFGLTHHSNRRIAQSPHLAGRHFASIIGLKLFLGLLYLLVALLLGYFLGYWHERFALLALLSFSQFLSSLVLFFRSHLAGLQLFRWDSLMSVLDKLLLVLSCSVVLYTSVGSWQMNITLFAALQAASYLVAALVGYLLVAAHTQQLRLRFAWSRFGFRLKQGLPYALLILLMAFYTRVDSVMIQQLRGDFENGVYAQAFRLLDAVNQPGYLFSVLLLPLFASMMARREATQELSRLAFTLILVLSMGAALAGFGTAPRLMAALYTQHPELSTPVFRVLIFSAVAFGSTYVFGTLLTARGNLRTLNIVAALGFGVNILGNLLLIPRYGAEGAAWSTLITQSLTALVQLAVAFRLERYAFKHSYWWRLGAWVALSATAAHFLPGFLKLLWWQDFLAIGLLVCALALGVGLLPLRDVWRVFAQKWERR